MKNIFINNKPYRLNKVPDKVFQGGDWSSGYEIADDADLNYSVIEIIESHINEGQMLWGKVDDLTWFILPHAISHKHDPIYEYMPKSDGAKDYYFNMLQCLDGDDYADFINQKEALRMLFNVTMEL